ncbi:MAG: type III pantothenate kinase [Clostridium sp.]|nr:type III pantothenate kinase [Acetatifactor muris]MCM1527873.1 type III pantothenate kinase [Bacteroides sp.]MCM1563916.1 type III pantothenate kinase [Clostridium sp.]
MILVVDVSNTHISFGVYEQEELKATFRLMAETPHTSDEYGIAITRLLEHNRIDPETLSGSVVASVVPAVMHSLLGALSRYIGTKPLIVGPGVKTGIRIATEDPRAIGADRIADAVAAYTKYGGPVLVLDFGTATTYDLITAEGSFTAGITAPGIRISAEALWTRTAKLPDIELKMPESILAGETVSSMQAGIMYGQIGQTEYVIRKVREESKFHDLKVVATGGLGRLIADETKAIDIYDPSLTLDGLRMIYDKNRKNDKNDKIEKIEKNTGRTG